MTCFNAEANDREAKRVMQTSFKHSTLTALSYDLHAMQAAASRGDTFKPTYLGGTAFTLGYAEAASLWDLFGCNSLKVSRKLVHKTGTFKSHHMLCWVDCEKRAYIGKARLFFEIGFADGIRYFAWVDGFAEKRCRDGQRKWTEKSGCVFVPAAAIIRAVCFVKIDDYVIADIPLYIR